MRNCTYVSRKVLDSPLNVSTAGPLDFSAAKSIADQKAKERASRPMLLAWFDRKALRYSPDQICCNCHKPTWQVYAETRGGHITVNVNNEEYIFVYRDVEPDVLAPR
jgi:hypothetical protein